MHVSRPFLAVTAALALAACQPMTDDMPQPDSCNAAAYQALIGTAADTADFSGHKSVRIIPPNSAITMDYNPERLNVVTDAAGIIQKLSCG